MAPSDQRPANKVARPAGVEGDGLDAYPTYHDGAAPARSPTDTKPTDVGLARSKRTYGLPILIGLIVFALVIIIRIAWGSFNMAETTEEALTPGDPAGTPAVTAPLPATAETPTAPTETPEEPGSLGEDEQPQTQTGPGEVGADPGAIDVPGGATTGPVEPAPAQ